MLTVLYSYVWGTVDLSVMGSVCYILDDDVGKKSKKDKRKKKGEKEKEKEKTEKEKESTAKKPSKMVRVLLQLTIKSKSLS